MNELLLQLKTKLVHRGIRFVYVQDSQSALHYLKEQIPPGSQVMTGGSDTVKSIGFEAILNSGDYDYLRPKIADAVNSEERHKLRRMSIVSDYYVGGVNAISMTGQIVNIDGSGNRVAAYSFGAGKVFLVAGINKIEPNIEAAIARVRHVAAPKVSAKLHRNPPCVRDGICRNEECYPPDRQCGKLMIIENESIPDRMTLILIGEEVGF